MNIINTIRDCVTNDTVVAGAKIGARTGAILASGTELLTATCVTATLYGGWSAIKANSGERIAGAYNACFALGAKAWEVIRDEPVKAVAIAAGVTAFVTFAASSSGWSGQSEPFEAIGMGIGAAAAATVVGGIIGGAVGGVVGGAVAGVKRVCHLFY